MSQPTGAHKFTGRPLQLTASGINVDLQPWQDLITVNLNGISADATTIILDQNNFNMYVVPPEPTFSQPTQPTAPADDENQDGEEEQSRKLQWVVYRNEMKAWVKDCKDARENYTWTVQLRDKIIEKNSKLTACYKVMWDAVSRDYQDRLKQRDISEALRVSNPMVLLREIRAIARGEGTGSSFDKLSKVITSLASFMTSNDGDNTEHELHVVETLWGMLSTSVRDIRDGGKEDRFKAYMFFKHLQPVKYKAVHDRYDIASSHDSTLHQLPATIAELRSIALSTSLPGASPARTEKRKNQQGGGREDEVAGAVGAVGQRKGGAWTGDKPQQEGDRPVCEKCGKNHATEMHDDDYWAKKKKKKDERRNSTIGPRDYGPGASQNKKPRNNKDSSVRIYRGVPPTGMDIDAVTSGKINRVVPTKHIEKPETFDTGAQIAISANKSDLSNIKKSKITVSTVAGNVTFNQAGFHNELGTEVVYDPGAEVSLMNCTQLEQKHNFHSVSAAAVGVCTRTGKEVIGLTAISFKDRVDGKIRVYKREFAQGNADQHLFVLEKSNSRNVTIGHTKRTLDDDDRDEDDEDDDEDEDEDEDDWSQSSSDSYDEFGTSDTSEDEEESEHSHSDSNPSGEPSEASSGRE
jgi:hypothetical protein